MSIFAPINWLILISFFESIKCLKGSPVVNRDTNLNLDDLEEITTQNTTLALNQNPDDNMIRSGSLVPEEENSDPSKTIIIVVVFVIVFFLLTIFNHVIVPKVNLCKNKVKTAGCPTKN